GEAGANGTAFVAVTRQGPYLMRARESAVQDALEQLPDLQRNLDVVQLHRIMLERVLGISEEAIRNQQHIRYERDAFEAISWVRQGANVAFLMNPAKIEQVRDIAFAGEVLPQKSTDFYPKLLSGLTIYALEEIEAHCGRDSRTLLRTGDFRHRHRTRCVIADRPQ